jgi:hypothetical protein
VDILHSEGIYIELGKTVRNSWCPVLHTKGLQNEVDSILFRFVRSVKKKEESIFRDSSEEQLNS